MLIDEMVGERVRLRIDADGVADVRLWRADKMNALDAAMFAALRNSTRRSTPMATTILHVDSSPLGEASASRRLTADIVAALANRQSPC